MKIAIVGAPTSGKTELAEALKKKLDGEVAIIDDYVDDIGRQSDLAMAETATYLGNLCVITGRFGLERRAIADGADHVISCGTMIESSVYATMEAVRGSTEPHWIRIQHFMALLGSLYQDTFASPVDGYNHVFALRLKDPDVETIEGQVDRNLFMALNAFGVHFTVLDDTVENNVEKAYDEIKQRIEEQEKFDPAFIRPETSKSNG